jgi:CHRD domain-containing protein
MAIVAVAAFPLAAAAQTVRTNLNSFEEVPTLSTPGNGRFTARIRSRTETINYTLSFGDTVAPVTQAHIHFGKFGEAGPIVVFLCTNAGNGPQGTQECPATGGTITGDITPDQILGNAEAQGLAAGDFDALVRAIRSGAAYVNVHSATHTAGEIRGQLP